jgi:hypothetical protein
MILRGINVKGTKDTLERQMSKAWRKLTMPCKAQASKRKASKKAVPVLGVAGFSLIAGGASTAVAVPTATMPAMNIAPNQELVLSDEEISDVNLATFYVFDKESTLPEGTVQLAAAAAAEVVAVAEAAVDAEGRASAAEAAAGAAAAAGAPAVCRGAPAVGARSMSDRPDGPIRTAGPI